MTATFCGLICCPTPKERVPVPLKSVSVHADIRGWTAAVTAELAYQNTRNEPIECQFIFPLTDTSAVYRLEADIGGKKLKAECRPRKEAEETYRDAVDSGQAGVLLENQQGSPDVFRILLGNLPPNQEAKVTIGYVQPADRDPDGSLTLTLPAVLNPRYVPGHVIKDAEKLKEQFHLRVPYVAVSDVTYTMTFAAKIHIGPNNAIAQVSATNAADVIKTAFDSNKLVANVTLEGKFTQDHDFGLRVVPADPWKPTAFVEPGQSSDTKNWLTYDIAAAWFEPEASKDKAVGTGVNGDEYWLVIDRSGSMDGEKIRDAKTALILFVKSLPVGCKFNIVGFGSTFLSLFTEGSVNYAEETIAKAVQHSNELEADLGGTEILEPLNYIYGQPKPTAPGARQFVILLTDGEVGNTEEVINVARKNASSTRVFTIGIGEGVSSALVNGLARVSGGVSEFVRSANDRLQAKVISLLKAATNPAAEGLKIDWNVSGGKVISLMPDSVPTAAYQGRPVMQYALIERHVGNNVDGSATLTATIGGKPVVHKLSISIPSSVSSLVGDAMPLHRLAAKARIQEMADTQNYTDYEAHKKELTSISVATGVLCQETAFVAVDPDTKSEIKDTKGRPYFVDIERPTSYAFGGFGGGGMLRCMAMPMRAMAAPPMMGFGAPGGRGGMMMKKSSKSSMSNMVPETLSMSHRRDEVDGSESEGMDACDFAGGEVLEMAKEQKADSMDSLVRLQNFNGSWSLNAADFVKAVSSSKASDEASIKQHASTALSNKQVTANDATVATFVALAFLSRRYKNRHDEWELIEQKAVSFLRGSVGANANIDELIELVANALAF